MSDKRESGSGGGGLPVASATVGQPRTGGTHLDRGIERRAGLEVHCVREAANLFLRNRLRLLSRRGCPAHRHTLSMR